MVINPATLQGLLASLGAPKKQKTYRPGQIGYRQPSRTDLFPTPSGIDSPSGDDPYEAARGKLRERAKPDTFLDTLIEGPSRPELAVAEDRNIEGEAKARGIASALTGLLSLVSGRGRDIGRNSLAASLGLQQGQDKTRAEYLSGITAKNKAAKEGFDMDMDYAKQRLAAGQFNLAKVKAINDGISDEFSDQLELGKAESARQIGLGNLEANRARLGAENDPAKIRLKALAVEHTQLSQLINGDPVKFGQLSKPQQQAYLDRYSEVGKALGASGGALPSAGDFPDMSAGERQRIAIARAGIGQRQQQIEIGRERLRTWQEIERKRGRGDLAQKFAPTIFKLMEAQARMETLEDMARQPEPEDPEAKAKWNQARMGARGLRSELDGKVRAMNRLLAPQGYVLDPYTHEPIKKSELNKRKLSEAEISRTLRDVGFQPISPR